MFIVTVHKDTSQGIESMAYVHSSLLKALSFFSQQVHSIPDIETFLKENKMSLDTIKGSVKIEKEDGTFRFDLKDGSSEVYFTNGADEYYRFSIHHAHPDLIINLNF